MSASEKLKALDRQALLVPFNFRPGDSEMAALEAIRAALPQIIAVVKEAENGYTEENEDANRCGCCHRLTWRGHAGDCPLVALEEALS